MNRIFSNIKTFTFMCLRFILLPMVDDSLYQGCATKKEGRTVEPCNKGPEIDMRTNNVAW